MSTNCDFRPFHVVIASPAEFTVSFESASAALEQVDRLFIEPDGSFVWAGDGWQLDGTLYDRGGRLEYVELKGALPIGALESLLQVFGWPTTPVTFQLMREGKTLDESEFRAWLAQPFE